MRFRPTWSGKNRSVFFLSAVFVMLFSACSARKVERTLTSPQKYITVDGRSPFLKAHMTNGLVYVFSDWSVGDATPSICGEGELLGVNRELLSSGSFSVRLDSVAILETNVSQLPGSVMALSIISGVSLSITVYCQLHPKACFGSCPTFYVSDGEKPLLQSEGFSASVTRALEATDIDALYRAKPKSRDLEITMRNEAMETHVLQYVHVLALPKSDGHRVFATQDGQFWEAGEPYKLQKASAPEGECSDALREFDDNERLSYADSTDLTAREIIDLEFDKIPDGDVGLVLASRQSLLTTFLFYQTLAYMGQNVGAWFALLESGDSAIVKKVTKFLHKRGRIEVLTEESGQWKLAGRINEVGPLATDVKIVPLPKLSSGKVRLRMPKGFWRLDYAALTPLKKAVQPLRLSPFEVYHHDAQDPSARQKLSDSTHYLVTLPGDEYKLVYRLPEDFSNYELFLESRGYYLEWMRQEWLKEENKGQVVQIFMDSDAALRAMAPIFKNMEKEMEQAFWNSKYEK